MSNLKNSISPLVSVIIPTYNAEKFIERTVSSVRKQTYTNWELIIVDDASTDGTVQILENLQRIDSRISIVCFSKNSGGPARPKNFGIKESRGEFVAFLDHDDEWFPEKIEKQINFLLKGNIDFVTCDSLVTSNESFIGVCKIPKVSKDFLKEEILRGNFIHSCSTWSLEEVSLIVLGDLMSS